MLSSQLRRQLQLALAVRTFQLTCVVGGSSSQCLERGTGRGILDLLILLLRSHDLWCRRRVLAPDRNLKKYLAVRFYQASWDACCQASRDVRDPPVAVSAKPLAGGVGPGGGQEPPRSVRPVFFDYPGYQPCHLSLLVAG